MSRFGQMTEAEKKAEEMRLKDAEMLERRKKKFDAARFSHIENTNKVHGQPKPQASQEQPNWRSESDAKKEESKKKGWKIFKKKDKNSTNEVLNQSPNTMMTLKDPPPIAAKSVKPDDVPVEMSPDWAGVDQQNQRAHPNHGHSSDASFPRLPSAAKIPTHKPQNPRPPTDPKKPMYETAGYGTSGRKKDANISSTIAAFQAGFKPITGKPRQMKKENVVSSSSESMDARGNITRTITKKITDPNGKTRTETEIIEIPTKR